MFDLGIRIRQARKGKWLKQVQLAEMAGIARKSLPGRDWDRAGYRHPQGGTGVQEQKQTPANTIKNFLVKVRGSKRVTHLLHDYFMAER